MTRILRSTLASAFAITSIAGASMAFAADNGGKNGDNGGKNNNTSATTSGKNKSKSNKCSDSGDTTASSEGANCTTEPNDNAQ